MLLQWQPGIVRQIEQATHNTRRYWVELPEAEAFHYKPGQFVTLDLPIHEQRNKRWRSYSIAAAPDGSNVIELVIVFTGVGTGSRYLFEHVKEGTELTLRGPQGVFVLPEQLEEDLMLICTGTGIAPFRSMLQHLHTTPMAHKAIHLIYGCRTRGDILYPDEMIKFTETVPNFQYHLALSREEWEGHNGYVHKVYEQLCADRQPARFMLCGWKDMIDEAKKRIVGMGYPPKSVHLEIYG
jgi:ferredoxin-NADP reductase